jgi:NAD(P)-dependent dehydrogenase (short-subunit alcohol dehydrogenase family)
VKAGTLIRTMHDCSTEVTRAGWSFVEPAGRRHTHIGRNLGTEPVVLVVIYVLPVGSCNAERMPFVGGSVYAMAKAALVGLVKGLARDLGPRGITVNNIQPGPIDTDMNPANGDFADMLRTVMALPHYGTADEIAVLVAYLAGPEAGFVTGASLTIDGGFTA